MLQKMCHWCFYLNCLTWRTSLALVLTPTRFEGDRVGDLDGDFEGDLVGLSGTIVPDEFDDVVMSVAVVDDVRVVVAALEVLELIEPLWTSDSCFRRRPRFLGSAESPGTNNIKQFFAVIVSFEGKLGLTCVVWPSVRPDLAKFRHFGKTLTVFSYLAKCWAYFGTFGKLPIGLIFIVANGEILKNNLTILSHWWPFE